MTEAETEAFKALRAEVSRLDREVEELRASSWMVSSTWWQRALAVVGHAIVGYILLGLTIAFVAFVFDIIATMLSR